MKRTTNTEVIIYALMTLFVMVTILPSPTQKVLSLPTLIHVFALVGSVVFGLVPALCFALALVTGAIFWSPVVYELYGSCGFLKLVKKLVDQVAGFCAGAALWIQCMQVFQSNLISPSYIGWLFWIASLSIVGTIRFLRKDS